jgi:hypothetical protein
VFGELQNLDLGHTDRITAAVCAARTTGARRGFRRARYESISEAVGVDAIVLAPAVEPRLQVVHGSTLPCSLPVRVDPRKLKPWVRAGVFAAVAVVLYLMWTHYGWMRVPGGCDSMPDLPPGTLCLVAEHPDEVPVGSVVFAAVPGGGVVVSRVVGSDAETVSLEHDDPRSRCGFGRARGAVARGAVLGLVLTWFESGS